MRLSIAGILVLMALPAASTAQVLKGTIPNAPRILATSDIAAISGTSISSAATFLGSACGDGCFIAKTAAGGKPAVTLHLSTPGKHATEFRTGLLVSHAAPHSVDLSIRGADIFGLLCNGHGALQASPHYAAMGASNQGFTWTLYDGAKILKSGHSSGEAVSFGTGKDENAAMGPMELAVSDRGAFEVIHGGQRIVITPDDKAAIGAKTKGYVSFEDLGLRVAGPSEFALVKPALKFGVQPPGV